VALRLSIAVYGRTRTQALFDEYAQQTMQSMTNKSSASVMKGSARQTQYKGGHNRKGPY
jgi:hypothetical protein